MGLVLSVPTCPFAAMVGSTVDVDDPPQGMFTPEVGALLFLRRRIVMISARHRFKLFVLGAYRVLTKRSMQESKIANPGEIDQGAL